MYPYLRSVTCHNNVSCWDCGASFHMYSLKDSRVIHSILSTRLGIKEAHKCPRKSLLSPCHTSCSDAISGLIIRHWNRAWPCCPPEVELSALAHWITFWLVRDKASSWIGRSFGLITFQHFASTLCVLNKRGSIKSEPFPSPLSGSSSSSQDLLMVMVSEQF